MNVAFLIPVVVGLVVGIPVVILTHDLNILQEEHTTTIYDRQYNYYTKSMKCEIIQDRIDSYDKFWTISPNKALTDAYRDKCI